MPPRWTPGLLLVWMLAGACSGESPSNPQDASIIQDTHDAGDAGDAGLVDNPEDGSVAEDDAGDGEDGGLPHDGGDPKPDPEDGLLNDLVVLGDYATQVRILGSQSSTVSPTLFLNSDPGLSYAYWLESTAFLLETPNGTQPPLLAYFDFFGMGRSPATAFPSDTVSVHDQLLDNLARMVGLVQSYDARPVNLVAHGYTSLLAVLYAKAHPEAVKHLVLINPGPLSLDDFLLQVFERDARLSAADLERLNQIRHWQHCPKAPLRCYGEQWQVLGKRWVCPGHEDLFRAIHFDTVNMDHFLSNSLLSRYYREQRFDYRPAIQGLSVPTTMMVGACDPTPAQVAESYKKRIPGLRLERFSASGHFPMYEEPARFQSRLKHALQAD